MFLTCQGLFGPLFIFEREALKTVWKLHVFCCNVAGLWASFFILGPKCHYQSVILLRRSTSTSPSRILRDSCWSQAACVLEAELGKGTGSDHFVFSSWPHPQLLQCPVSLMSTPFLSQCLQKVVLRPLPRRAVTWLHRLAEGIEDLLPTSDEAPMLSSALSPTFRGIWCHQDIFLNGRHNLLNKVLM